MSTLRVGTFNLLYANGETGPGSWSERRSLSIQAIERMRADVLGLQEAFPEVMEDVARVVGDLTLLPGPSAGSASFFDLSSAAEMLQRALRTRRRPKHSTFERLRSERRDTGEHQPIAYHPGRLEPLESGAFWISPTPDRAGAIQPLAVKPYFVHWVRFARRASGRPLLVLNAHLAHGPWNHALGVRTIANHIEALDRRAAAAGEDPPDVCLVGDFNALPRSGLVRGLTAADGPGFIDAARGAPERTGPGATYHWGVGSTRFALNIDYVFARGALRPLRTEVIDVHEGRLYPSDHHALVVEFDDPD